MYNRNIGSLQSCADELIELDSTLTQATHLEQTYSPEAKRHQCVPATQEVNKAFQVAFDPMERLAVCLLQQIYICKDQTLK